MRLEERRGELRGKIPAQEDEIDQVVAIKGQGNKKP